MRVHVCPSMLLQSIRALVSRSSCSAQAQAQASGSSSSTLSGLSGLSGRHHAGAAAPSLGLQCRSLSTAPRSDSRTVASPSDAYCDSTVIATAAAASDRKLLVVMGIESTCDDSAAAILALDEAGTQSSKSSGNKAKVYPYHPLTIRLTGAGFAARNPSQPPPDTRATPAANPPESQPEAQPAEAQPTHPEEFAAAVLGEGVSSAWSALVRQGGVHPLHAMQHHVTHLPTVCKDVLAVSGKAMSDVNFLAYSYAPGIASCLLKGREVVTQLARDHQLPVVPVHHHEAHILTATLTEPQLQFPYLALLASGGDFQLLYVAGLNEYKLLGKALDDAPGDALDKMARTLVTDVAQGGSAGAALERLALTGDPNAFEFPDIMANRLNCDVSFTGLKASVHRAITKSLMDHGHDPVEFLRAQSKERFDPTLVLRPDLQLVRRVQQRASPRLQSKQEVQPTTAPPTSTTQSPATGVPGAADIAASLLSAAVRHISQRCMRAFLACAALGFKPPRALVLGGGVTANTQLRESLAALVRSQGIPLVTPPRHLCTDNAVMIAWCAMKHLQNGTAKIVQPGELDSLEIHSTLPIGVDIRDRVAAQGIRVSMSRDPIAIHKRFAADMATLRKGQRVQV
ncbi:O-sialoglycoprotein endopeptidase [Capsaspora owczarzaki ATCC 30864]|uniref:O-sialoglycoprotein endopeptidase n=1 Tax=Capsaspora owczarzaki (strain ATCC 30864) TaxID=595528 RepID=A0A0D2VVI1_CAPO3|nr:O-sialoglycoprotein endopeptidase [Capsaspora owczarzaki ATCC 30864]KJE95492.1 O-sialoglycoprotein endopeptidase [Capsaspora owczarzaki ATCC 30864]|eukprot:XP_004345531.2 O-sialoglycoprotein endopeptidase [Capsaspora owczarzaki ATCC 30864]